jgi:hypothetical protein
LYIITRYIFGDVEVYQVRNFAWVIYLYIIYIYSTLIGHLNPKLNFQHPTKIIFHIV